MKITALKGKTLQMNDKSRRSNLISFETCLLDAYANEYYHPAQEERFIWALGEAIRRLGNRGSGWNFRRAVKGHECVRGCKIPPKEYYVAFTSPTFFIPLKLCFRCASMILEFMGVDKLPVFGFTHGDAEKKEPVRLKAGKTG